MSAKPRPALDRPGRRHRWARRISPIRLQEHFLKLQPADRLQEYRKREAEFQGAVEPYRGQVARRVDALERASRLLVQPADDTPDIREQRALQLVVNAVARYWRRRTCQWLEKPGLLPRIVGGEYFNAPPDAIHWLDLASEIVTEAIHHELKGLDYEKQPRRPRAGNTAGAGDEERERADLSLLTAELRDRFLQDPTGTGASSLCHHVRARLMKLAWQSPSLPMRRFASEHLRTLDRSACPDLRSGRTHRRHRLKQRSREEQARRARLAAERQESNSRLADFCVEQMKEDLAMVPAPLRICETVSAAMAASSLLRFRRDPAQPRAWLKTFRRTTPRLQRQNLIDDLDLGALLESLEGASTERRAVQYPLVLYVVAARRLASPAASSPPEREALRQCIARVFGLELLEVARDVTRMRLQLEHDHRRWQHSQQRRPSSPIVKGGP